MNISNLVRPAIQKMQILKWGNAPDGFIRIHTGENPEVFPPAIEAAKKELYNLNQYPDPQKLVLRDLLAKKNKMTSENIFIGNGVDGLIELVAKVFLEPDDEILIPKLTFPAYIAAAELMGATVKTCRLESNFSLDFQKFKNSITKKTKLIFLANPNNPTGNILFTKEQIEEFLQEYSGILVVDEEYFDFAKITALPLIKKHKNLIVLRGFSKAYGMAGIRIGSAFADREIIQYFEKSEGSSQVFAVNRIALKMAESVLKNSKEADAFTKKFIDRKKSYENELSRISGVKIMETKTAFCIFELPIPADEFKEKLWEKKIAVKSMSIFEDVPENLGYSAVPKDEDRDFVIKTIQNILHHV